MIELRYLETPKCRCHEIESAACSDCGRTVDVLQLNEHFTHPDGGAGETGWRNVPRVPISRETT